LLLLYQIKSYPILGILQKPEYNKNTIVTWKLEQLDKDKTKLTLIHSEFTNADRLQYDDHNKGWSWHIKRLENLMDKNTNAN
jgi:hypothetical protein